MGTSRGLQKRLEEQRLKKEQDERMKTLEGQVSQLNECNMQWMHYYQQQQNQQWQAAAAWQWEAHAQQAYAAQAAGHMEQAYAAQAAGHMEGLRLFFFNAWPVFFVLASCNAKPVSHLCCHLFTCLFCPPCRPGRWKDQEA